MMKNYIDRKILETLITKYGAKGVNSAINRLNEHNENPKSGIFIESHDHLNCDSFRILVLDNDVNILKNDPLEIECESQYSGKRYIENLEPKNGNDYIEVNYVGDLWEKSLCLINVVKALHIKYPELPIYCFTMGWNTWKGGYVDEQKAFNSIFSKYLRGLSFEFIPGTMGEFLKNNNMNESLKTHIINEMEEHLEPITIYIDYVVDNSMQLRKDIKCFRKNDIKAECEIEEQFDNMELTAISEKSKYALTDWLLNYYLDDADLIEEYWSELLPYVDDCEGRFINYNNCF